MPRRSITFVESTEFKIFSIVENFHYSAHVRKMVQSLNKNKSIEISSGIL